MKGSEKMGRRKTDRIFNNSALLNNLTYNYYFNKLFEIATAMFEWKNLPDTVDPIYLEKQLFYTGSVLFFKDDVLGYLTLKMVASGPINVYNIPTRRRGIAPGYNGEEKDENNSVIIYNNYTRTPSFPDCQMFATRLWNIQRTIDVNINAQKTPILILCDENERLSMENLYMNYDGNKPVIFASKKLNPDNVTVLNTNAPFVSKDLMNIKNDLWNEALTYLGVPNVSIQKRERLVRDEATRNMGGVVASKFTRLDTRKYACEQINKIFKLDIDVAYKDEYEGINIMTGETVNSDDTEDYQDE